jgi:hypothetical protein
MAVLGSAKDASPVVAQVEQEKKQSRAYMEWISTADDLSGEGLTDGKIGG